MFLVLDCVFCLCVGLAAVRVRLLVCDHLFIITLRKLVVLLGQFYPLFGNLHCSCHGVNGYLAKESNMEDF